MVAKIKKLKQEAPLSTERDMSKFLNALIQVDTTSGDNDITAQHMRDLQAKFQLNNYEGGDLSKLALYINFFIQSNSSKPITVS